MGRPILGLTSVLLPNQPLKDWIDVLLTLIGVMFFRSRMFITCLLFILLVIMLQSYSLHKARLGNLRSRSNLKIGGLKKMTSMIMPKNPGISLEINLSQIETNHLEGHLKIWCKKNKPL
jgi:hypothetical protein